MRKFLIIFIIPLITFSQETIKMEKDNNLWLIPGEINGVDNRDCRFVFDVEIGGIIINNTVLVTMLLNEIISTSDISGSTGEIKTHEIQDNVNNIVEKLEINIDKITIGGYNVVNLTASVSDQISAPIILGQSFLSQFPHFNQDDGNLVLNPPTAGCTIWTACNYNPEAIENDGSCEYETCYGCMDFTACNYDNTATFTDASCNYAATYYDCDEICLNDIDSDGICDELEVEGCTDSNAYNYTQSATDDDGSCFYLIYGCTDIDAVNYNPDATVDNGSCNYATNNETEDSVLDEPSPTIDDDEKIKTADTDTAPEQKTETNISWSSYSDETTEGPINTNTTSEKTEKKIKIKKKDDGKDHVLSYNFGWKYFKNSQDINKEGRMDDLIFNLTYSKNTPRLGFYLSFQTKHHNDSINATYGYHIEDSLAFFHDNLPQVEGLYYDYANYAHEEGYPHDMNFSYYSVAFGGGLNWKLFDHIPLWVSLGLGAHTLEALEYRKILSQNEHVGETTELWMKNEDFSANWEGYGQVGFQFKLFNRVVVGYRVFAPFSIFDNDQHWIGNFGRQIKYGGSFSIGVRLF